LLNHEADIHRGPGEQGAGDECQLRFAASTSLSLSFAVVSAKRTVKPSNRSWVTYERSYLVTLGVAFVGLTAFIWRKQHDTFAEWPTWAYFVFFGFPILGLVLLGVGLFAGRDRIEKWADGASRHEASFIIMIVAFPVFLLMSIFEKRE
jgi:hypothetical protein